MKPTLYAALVAAVLPLPALAQTAGPISVHDGYARSASTMSGAAFLQIDNSGPQDCQLVAVTSPAANKTELHTHIEENSMMKMVHVPEGFSIPAGGSFALERGGAHVMLMDLTGPIEADGEVALTMDFGDCGMVEVTVPVDNDRKPDSGDHATDAEHASH